jgi:tetratricopeptide (TPR) repeat protein
MSDEELMKIIDICGLDIKDYNPIIANKFYEKADKLNEKKKWLKAEENIRKAIEHDPYVSRHWTLYSMCLNRLSSVKKIDRHEQNVAVFDFVMGRIDFEGLRNLANNIKEYQELEEEALSYLDNQEWAKADQAFRKLLEYDDVIIKDKKFMYWNAIGVCLRNMENYLEAEEAHRKAIEINNKDFNTWFLLGGLLLDIDRYEDAEAMLKEALKIDPKHGTTWRLLGSSIASQDRVDEAEIPFRNAVKYDPSDSDAQALLRRCLDYIVKKK